MTKDEAKEKIAAARKAYIARDHLLPAKEYLTRIREYTNDVGVWNYVQECFRENDRALLFPKDEMVPGCAWPGNYGRVSVTDYRTYMKRKGRRKVILENGDMEFYDRADQDELIPYELPTTAQNIAKEVARKRTSLYSFPHRVYLAYKDRLLVKVQGEVCSGSTLTEEMLTKVLEELTPFERSEYEQSLYKIDVSLYPSVEQPVRVRIDGIDDGAEEKLFASIEDAEACIEDIALGNYHDRRRWHGFKSTD